MFQKLAWQCRKVWSLSGFFLVGHMLDHVECITFQSIAFFFVLVRKYYLLRRFNPYRNVCLRIFMKMVVVTRMPPSNH